MDVPNCPKRKLSSYSERHLNRQNKVSTADELQNIKGLNSPKIFLVQGSYVDGIKKVKLFEDLSEIDSASDDGKKRIRRKNKFVPSDSDSEDSNSSIQNFPNPQKKIKESCVTSVPFTDGRQSFSINKNNYPFQNLPNKMQEKSLTFSNDTQISAAGSLGVVRAVDYFNKSATADKQAETNTKILERILEKVNYLVTKVRVLEEKIDSQQRINSTEESAGVSEAMKMFPLQDEMALHNLESFILDEVNKKLLVTSLSSIGGNTPFKVVTNILKRAIADRVAEEFSWAGAKKKKEFRKLEFAQVVLEATRRRFPSITEAEVSAQIANWLRHAKQRRERNEKIN